MEVTFGFALDGAAWPEGTGKLALGPRGLLRLLATRLGLSRPEVPPALRVAAARARLADATPGWCATSFAVDSWGTARELLRLRDEARAAGWQGADGGNDLPPRLAAVAAIWEGLPAGEADLLAEVAARLEELTHAPDQNWPLGISLILCREDPALLPHLWPRIFALLAQLGVEVSASSPEPAQGILTVVDCEDEWAAATSAARLLASRQAAGLAAQTVVLAGGETAPLDRELNRRGLPAVGACEKASGRGYQQALPLLLRLLCSPTDVPQLATLLQLTLCADAGLLPGWATHPLLEALRREPGVGSAGNADSLWQQRVSELADGSLHGPSGKVLSADENALLALIASVPAVPLNNPELPLSLVGTAIRLVRKRAAKLAVLPSGEHLFPYADSLQTMLDVLALLAAGRETLPLTEVLRLVAECDRNAATPDVQAQACPWQNAASPAHLGAAGPLVVWWQALASAVPRQTPWDESESRALKAGGAHLLSDMEYARLDLSCQLAPLAAGQNIVAFLPRSRDGQPAEPSPLLTYLASGYARPGEQISQVLQRLSVAAPSLCTPADANSPERAASWSLTGTSLPLRESTARMRAASPMPPQTFSLAAPEGALLPESLSATQIKELLECPLAWVLQRRLRVKEGNLAQIATGPRMIGTLLHALFEKLVADGVSDMPSPDTIRAAFTNLLPRYAGELLLPGREHEKERACADAVAAMTELFAYLLAKGLRVDGCEVEFAHELDIAGHTVTVRGSRDVDVTDAHGKRGVIDLKWTRHPGQYRDQAAAAQALQLAVYYWSVGMDSPGQAPETSFYMLRQGEAYTPESDRMEQFWPQLRDLLAQRVRELEKGQIAPPAVLSGRVAEQEPHPLLASPIFTEGRHTTKPGAEASSFACPFCALFEIALPAETV
ncbi:PD-(D/E)XK nuclease family protein [Dermabacteraceae bacterium TAE3-ERU27]|nr:PD-(D/E)XK nuclease family protein [Dermabacteraceae bacterium TAE3-ERU27]